MIGLRSGVYHAGVNKHMILTHGRSGSNYLVNTLNLHPQIVNYNEILGPWTKTEAIYQRMRRQGRSGTDFLDWVYHSRALYYGAQFYSALARLRRGSHPQFKCRGKLISLGFKEFTHKLENIGCADYLESRPSIHVLFLLRNNLLKRYISQLQMMRTGVAATENQVEVSSRLSIDVEHMLHNLAVLDESTSRSQTMVERLVGNPVLTIRYESAYRTPESLAEMSRRVFSFLGVEPIPNLSRQKKILPSKIEDIVHNYDEVVRALNASSYARFLEDD